jgi:hypothetical protein
LLRNRTVPVASSPNRSPIMNAAVLKIIDKDRINTLIMTQ